MRRFTKIIVMAGLTTAALTGTADALAMADARERPASTVIDRRSPDARDGAQPASTIIDLRSPDARDAARRARASDIAHKSGVADVRSPDARDTSGVTTYAPGLAPTRYVVQAPATGFEWGDAGIGAAAMVGLIALGGGTLLLLSSRRRDRRMPGAIG